MGRRGLWAAVAVLGAVLAFRCGPAPQPKGGNDGDTGGEVDSGTPVVQTTDAGTKDAGTKDAGTPDAGTPDAGTPDAGTPDAGTPDAGTPDAGTPDAGTVTVEFPSSAGWTFLSQQDGLPADILGVSADEGGNIWVAGGEEGLFVLKKGQSTFQRFTLADGLHPYGYMADGSDAPGPYYLKVISVAGGPAGTVFVGYEGKPGCEFDWGGSGQDPSIYKSGDADKVTLTSTGIKVVHYDIFSGPNVVKDEKPGREKLCNILRIAYDKNTSRVWFGGNHGFAMGFANFQGDPTCDGQLSCTGVFEHVHPAICAVVNGTTVVLTDSYYGVSPDPSTGDVWIGGANRATRFNYGTYNDYWSAQVDTEAGNHSWSRIDVWPDLVPESQCPTKEQRVDDEISSAAAMADGSVWFGSFYYGLAHLDRDGNLLGYRSQDLIDKHVRALAADPWDHSLWVGGAWGGVTRLKAGTVQKYSEQTFGYTLRDNEVSDLQVDRSSGSRRILVSFRSRKDAQGQTVPGAIGIYTGN